MAIWLQEKYIKTSAPTPEEADVAKYIAETHGGDFFGALENDRRFGVFFHLSPMRESLLNWYPFAPDATVLELGGGMGALTGMLCSRCMNVVSVEPDTFKARALFQRHKTRDNLTVINAEEYCGAEHFDYVVLIDPASPDADYLARIQARLKPHGRLLLAIENRFGLRYWCGKRSNATGLPFDGIIGNDGGVSKAKLRLNFERAGFEGQKWYYPMSDHWFAQDIFSENYLPDAYSTARLRPYVEPDRTLIMNEQRLYTDIIQNRVFEFFSNAYLIEARLSARDKPCGVDYAAVTTYRARENRFATLVMDDDTVQKIPLHPDGERGVRSLIENHAALAKRGINVVPLTLDDGCVVMPRVRHEPLIDYWQRTMQNGSFDFDAFSAMFDRLYDIVVRSSEADPPGSHGWDPSLGPVQKTAYLELVPANCFYNKENDELIFFDQEFTWPYCPLKLVLTRVVRSISSSTLSTDKTAAAFFDMLKLRFGLDECWDVLCSEERRFFERVFKHVYNGPIVRRRAINENGIKNNVRRLLRAERDARATDEIPQYLYRTGVRNVAIYGYGLRGKGLHGLLDTFGIAVPFAIDRQGRDVEPESPLSIYSSLEDSPYLGNIDMIIVSPRDGADEIAEGLRCTAACPVVTIADIFNAIDGINIDPGI